MWNTVDHHIKKTGHQGISDMTHWVRIIIAFKATSWNSLKQKIPSKCEEALAELNIQQKYLDELSIGFPIFPRDVSN